MSKRKFKIVDRKLGREKALGQAKYPDLIEVHPGQPPKERLDTIIHEMLHLLEPEWPEERVVSYANDITRILWRDGFRRMEK